MFRHNWMILLMITLSLTFSSCQENDSQKIFSHSLRRAEKVIVYEGLPHQLYEEEQLQQELKNKATQPIHEYPFYQEPLTLTDDDLQNLTEIMDSSATYKEFSGEKKCGGFHPDFAIEWQISTAKYQALICFGCGEVKLFGPGYESRYDFHSETIETILKKYRKNRPARDEKSF